MAECSSLHTRSLIRKQRQEPISDNLPHRSPTCYYPRSKILEVFKQDDCLAKVFHCECETCRRDKGVGHVADNEPYFDERELLGKYATIYALLVYLYRPGLIRFFRRKGVFLGGNSFLAESQLEFLRQENVAHADSIISEIFHDQYMFHIRTLEPVTEPLSIDRREVLPIEEDLQSKGHGGFGDVYTFRIQHEEYRGSEFKEKRVRKFDYSKSCVSGS
jgi:hypothetical protein